MRLNFWIFTGLLIGGLLATPTPARAVNPGQWVHDNEADFQQAELDQVVVTNLGKLKLARAARVLAELEADSSIVYDLAATADGTTWLAVGPAGELMKLPPNGAAGDEDGAEDAEDDDEQAGNGDEKLIQLVATFEGHQVFALRARENTLWVALSGANSRIVEYQDGEPVHEYPLPDVRYVWDVVHDAETETLWIATGLPGNVWRLSLPEARAAAEEEAAESNESNEADADAPAEDEANADAENGDGEEAPRAEADAAADAPVELPAGLTAILETQQDNVLCLVHDAENKTWYAGTDGEGLVYRLRPDGEGEGEEGASFNEYVVYDAAEPEIGALLVAADGTLYIGTADAAQARPGRLEAALEESVGTPADEATVAQEGDDGEEPDLPIEPKPEPRAADSAADGEAEQSAAEDGAQDAEPQPDAADEDTAADGDDGEDDAGGDGEAAEGEAAPPTEQQYDALREAIRQRLAEAREGGRIDMQADGGTSGASGGDDRRLSPRRADGGSRGSSASARASREGNAVYALDEDGFVREVFRESVMILRMVEHEGMLLIATGNEGQLYRLDPAAEETTVIAKLESQQIPALLPRGDHVLIGAANIGQLLRLDRGFADAGHFTSDPLDAVQISLWGKLRLTAETPQGTGVQLQTRSGNVSDPDVGSWSPWSDYQPVEPPAAGAPAYLAIDSPPARFLQYRLKLTSDGQQSPAVDRLALKYLMPNLKPRIASVKAAYEPERGQNEDQPRHNLKIEWEATDANEDKLIHTVEVRPLGDEEAYVPLAKELTETNHTWDTRTIADGRYEIRITTSDRLDNVPGQVKTAQRVSSPVVVDNTAPVWEDVTVQPAGEDGSVTVTGKVTDALSPITGVRYLVDGEKPWQAVLPEDMIYDSTAESVSFTISDLSPGRHVIALRAVDALGNAAHVSRTVTVGRR